MRIAFVHDWAPDHEQELTWQDGLAAALRELINRGHDVRLYTCGEKDTVICHPYFDIIVSTNIKRDLAMIQPDVILHWADMTRPNAIPTAELGIPMAICFAGGDVINYNTDLFDHIFVESQVYADKLKDNGKTNYSIAFGTNTELFKPVQQNKVFDTIMPGTFAAWKRHFLYAQATQGLVSLACGYMYDDHEQECWQECLDRGLVVLPHVSAQVLHRLYAASSVCVIPSMSSGGSQRSVLEAMSMNMPLIVTDSDKFDYSKGYAWEAEPTVSSLRAYIAMLLDGEQEVNSRDYVMERWSEFTYADAIIKGLEAIA